MGTGHLVLAPGRRELLDPLLLLSGERLTRVLAGSVGTAVLLLVSRSTGTERFPLAGRWYGEPVVLAADTDDDGLHRAARDGFADVSLDAVRLLAAAVPGLLDTWAGQAAAAAGTTAAGGSRGGDEEAALVVLGSVASGDAGPVDVAVARALDRHVGPDWPSRYRRALSRGLPVARRAVVAAAWSRA